MAPTTYTPPINTYVPLESIVLTNAASSVSFFNIPQSDANGTYKDLVLVATGTITTGASLYMRFNNDSGTNYSYVGMYGVGSGSGTSYSGTGTSIQTGYFYDTLTQVRYQIMDYTASDKHKTVLLRRDNAGSITLASAERWASTSAVSSIYFTAGGGLNFNAGCTFTLYALHG